VWVVDLTKERMPVDGHRFDEFSRLLTRRGALRAAIAAVVAGGSLHVAAPTSAESARRTCRPAMAGCTRNSQCCSSICDRRTSTPRRRRNRCVCPEGTVACSGACVDLSSDSANCGACGNVCAEGDSCSDGECGFAWCTIDPDVEGFNGAPPRCIIATDQTVHQGADGDFLIDIDGIPTTPCSIDSECDDPCGEYFDPADQPRLDAICAIAQYMVLEWEPYELRQRFDSGYCYCSMFPVV
jgi:hypothetical protein